VVLRTTGVKFKKKAFNPFSIIFDLKINDLNKVNDEEFLLE
jgi:hypothetical protein